MASSNVLEASHIPREILNDLTRLLWGAFIKEDIFQRWNQGFVFSSDEPTALLQYDGGPCAVIVPIQGFFLKNLLFSTPAPPDSWRQTNGARRDGLLCDALADVLCKSAAGSGNTSFVLCHVAVDNNTTPEPSVAAAVPVSADPVSAGGGIGPSDCVCEAGGPSSEVGVALKETSTTAGNRGCEQFNAMLRLVRSNGRHDLVNLLKENLPLLTSQFGVLVFLYSILLTKGLDRIKAEMADGDEPLIDPIHGHGSQSLINLLLTGQAVPHVWDNEKNVSGLKLQGITSRSEIGFLTLLEHLRYCEVGWFMKNPQYPIWVLGSETHLTVLFSQDRSLVGDENQETIVRRAFSHFDEEGRGFINVESLGPLLSHLDLVSMPEYVKIISEKLDPEQLGVITFEAFVDEFYPGAFSTNSDNAVRPFTVYHYNGLQRSSSGTKVAYAEGTCTVPDMPELQMISDFSPIKTCLLTKWPTIELSWQGGVIPSMN
jgi:hypothetical protein